MCSDLLGAAILAAAPFVSSCPSFLLALCFFLPSVSSETGNHLILHAAANPICCGDSGGRAGSLTKPYKN